MSLFVGETTYNKSINQNKIIDISNKLEKYSTGEFLSKKISNMQELYVQHTHRYINTHIQT